ncbi:aldehyde dehydrogenase [Cohnella thailandensis]|uniref:Aldehyde dehydrogenase n=1 Tax=Cohnella thailandensis TaxID=557557 RepID=A0A841T220_9BACL|nr:aldehyde dehydrogenase [Cohnella thailandensis]MBB6636896.1 aldehyde dehydrogenase [Cohnella thailandensis]MBP1973225.1 aldehyde dehydrogenase (NAD+) [Cohnella thailandensis]
MSLIAGIVGKQRDWHAAGNTRRVEDRIRRLDLLKEAVKARERQVMDALRIDLGKSEREAYMTEIGIVYEEIRFIRKRLRKWAKPVKVKTAMTHIGSGGYIVSEPYGTVLIVAPFNYPFQLALSPLVGAIAAGNTAVLKPSELTPRVAAVLREIVEAVFPPEYVATVEGGVEASKELLEQPFDYIFFTGSVPVGKVVMEAAAKRLVPVTLELGGKSPCIVHRDADVKLAAKRIVFGKFMNAGQTCIAPDYVYVHRDRKAALLEELRAAISAFYGPRPIESEELGKIVNERHFDRLVGLLGGAEAVIGGDYDRESLKIAPTVLDHADWSLPVMGEEIFGPLLPMLEYSELDEVIAEVNARPKPLALYMFTRDKAAENRVIESIPFGGGCVNDTLMHIATPYLPFGGVGSSGIGSYHGIYSFRTFSHQKSVLKQTVRFDFPFRYPSAKNGLAILRKLFR